VRACVRACVCVCVVDVEVLLFYLCKSPSFVVFSRIEDRITGESILYPTYGWNKTIEMKTASVHAVETRHRVLEVSRSGGTLSDRGFIIGIRGLSRIRSPASFAIEMISLLDSLPLIASRIENDSFDLMFDMKKKKKKTKTKTKTKLPMRLMVSSLGECNSSHLICGMSNLCPRQRVIRRKSSFCH